MKAPGNPDRSELELLQREAARLRQSQARPQPGTESGPKPVSSSSMSQEEVSRDPGNSDAYRPAGQNPDPEAGTEKRVHQWGAQLETLAAELETAALAHPRLALLTAFSLGVVAGQLLSRKRD